MDTTRIDEEVREEVRRYEQYRQNVFRRQRAKVVQGAFLMGIGIVGYFIADMFARVEAFTRFGFLTIAVTSGLLVLAGLALLLMNYLQGEGIRLATPLAQFYGGGRIEMESSDGDSVDYLRRELSRLQSDFQTLKASKSDDTGQIDDLDELRKTLTTEITLEVEHRLSTDALTKAQFQEIRSSFANAYSRLSKALDEISRRGNLNLTIGFITTVLGAGSLGYMAFSAPPATDLKTTLAHYIPRLSTVVFLEVFAFFFLRLYKATLADSKFYQIELTSLATTDIALQAAMKCADSVVMAAVISEMAKTRKQPDITSEKVDNADIDVKGFADVLGKFGKLVLESAKKTKE